MVVIGPVNFLIHNISRRLTSNSSLFVLAIITALFFYYFEAVGVPLLGTRSLDAGK